MDDCHVRMAALQGEDQSCQCCGVTHRHSSCIMGRWSIEYDFRSSLVAIQETLTAQHYASDILRPPVLHLLRQHPGAAFQQDDVRPHGTRVYGLPASCWGSPVASQVPRFFSPIEHVWNQLGHHLRLSINLQQGSQTLCPRAPGRLLACYKNSKLPLWFDQNMNVYIFLMLHLM